MKNVLLLLTLTLITLTGHSQIAHDLEIYSLDGHNFTLTLNGRTMNEEPVSNIQIVDTHKDYVHAKIVFEDESIPTIERKVLQIGGVSEQEKGKPVSTVYKIVEKKGKYKLRFASRSEKKIQQEVNINQTTIPGRIVIIAPF